MELPHITKKQQEILFLLYKFRFLTRPQIQTLLHHKSTRRVNEWLPDLMKKKYVGRIFDNKNKINNVPAIYYIAENGIRFLKTQPQCELRYVNRLYTDPDKSQSFIDQCLLIADIYLTLIKKYGENPGFAFYTRSDYSWNGMIKEIFPYFVFRRDEGEPFYIVEIFHETAPKRRAIIPRLQQYIHFFTQEKWLQHELLPRILIICPNERKYKTIYKEARRILQDEQISDLSIYTTLQDQVKNQGITADIWEQVIED